MNSRPMVTITNSLIILEIMDQELTFASPGTIPIFHMAWHFHEGSQHFGKFSRKGAESFLIEYNADLFS